MLCHVMLSYVMLINFYAGLLLQPVMAGFPGGPQTKRKNKKNPVQTSIRYCRRTMTLYRTIKKLIMIMSHTIHCNTIKSHNTVHARTTLLKAAELVLLVLMEAIDHQITRQT